MTQTVGAVIRAVSEQFEAADLVYGHGTDNAWDEAVALVLNVTGEPDDAASLDVPLHNAQLERIRSMAGQRIERRVPLAYVTGRAHYVGLEFEIEPGVMVPRSPIGHLLPDALRPWLQAPRRVLDLCAGSGAIGIVAAYAYPVAAITLLELDGLARDVAAANVALHAMGDRVLIVEGDARAIPCDEKWDLVLCNPPYVSPPEMAALPAEYRAEPTQGLAGGGSDGFELIAGILEQLPLILADGGVFVCEVGIGRQRFAERFADLPVVWLDLLHGGEGVFLLEQVNL